MVGKLNILKKIFEDTLVKHLKKNLTVVQE